MAFLGVKIIPSASYHSTYDVGKMMYSEDGTVHVRCMYGACTDEVRF